MAENPNEIICSYEHHVALLKDLMGLSTQLRDAMQSLMVEMEGSAGFQYDILDANGQRLTYPIRVVSKTRVLD